MIVYRILTWEDEPKVVWLSTIASELHQQNPNWKIKFEIKEDINKASDQFRFSYDRWLKDLPPMGNVNPEVVIVFDLYRSRKIETANIWFNNYKMALIDDFYKDANDLSEEDKIHYGQKVLLPIITRDSQGKAVFIASYNQLQGDDIVTPIAFNNIRKEKISESSKNTYVGKKYLKEVVSKMSGLISKHIEADENRSAYIYETLDDIKNYPKEGQNNVWFHYTESETVIVFVHGLFSDSQGCWSYEPSKKEIIRAQKQGKPIGCVYWPDLVRWDSRFKNVSIFLGGYPTDIKSGTLEIVDCAKELYKNISIPYNNSIPPLLNKKKMIFIAHSFGGIVVRYLLDRNKTELADKKIGLLLMASPSHGSVFADKLKWLLQIYNHKIGKQLKIGSWSLDDLDDRFKQLVQDNTIKELDGIEAYEHKYFSLFKHIPFFKKLSSITSFLPSLRREKIVEKESASRYFGPPSQLPNTDHFSIVKTNGPSHPAHTLLVDFITKHESFIN